MYTYVYVYYMHKNMVGRIANAATGGGNTRRMRNVQKLIKMQMHSETTLMMTTATSAGRLRSS